MKRLFMIWMSLTCWVAVQAQDKAAADSAYAAGKYDEAISLYSAMLKEGESADIYYNLGNCYYKTDRIAHAVLNYERAFLLDPADADVRFNLELARAKTVDKIIPESEMFFITWFKSLVNVMSMDRWACTGVAAFVLMCLLAFVFYFSNRVALKKLGFFGALFMLLVVIFSNIFAYRQYVAQTVRTGAVVMTASEVVKSTPNESGTDLFVLHEGTRVEIIDDSMKDWKEIRIADGKRGWIPAKSMEII